MLVSPLGPLTVTVDGRPVALRRKERELLGALAVHAGVIVSDDALIEALWSGSPPETAAKSLHVHVNRLRAALHPAAVVRDEGGYHLAPDVVGLDSDRFERTVLSPASTLADLEAAAASWRGEPYEELAGWPPAVAAAAHLRELHSLLEDRVADAVLAERGVRYALPMLERLATAQPLRERRWEMLASALAADGRTVEALRTIDRAREALRETAGVDPGPGLVQLESDLLSGGPAPTRSDAIVTPPRTDPASTPMPVLEASAPVRLRARRPAGRAIVFVGAAGFALAGLVAAVLATRDEPRTEALRSADTGASVTAAPAEAAPADVAVTPPTEKSMSTDASASSGATTPATNPSVSFAPVFGATDPGATVEDVSCDEIAELAFAPTDAQGPRTAATRCAVLTVAERRDGSASGRVRLDVAFEPGPVDSRELPVISIGEMRDLAHTTPGDHVVISLRGLGGSEPSLDCPELVGPVILALGPSGPTADALTDAAATCAARLAAAGVDVAAYNSVGAADDVADLARLLGIERFQVSAFGSFGTQITQHLIRRHRPMVASAVVWDPQPAGVSLADVLPATLAHTWRAYTDLCAADPECGATFPDVAVAWDRLTADTQAAPLDIQVAVPGGGPPIDVRIDGRLLQLALAYAFDVPASMPLIASFVDGHNAAIAGQFGAGVALRTASSLAAGDGYRCTDEGAFHNAALADATEQLAGSFGLLRGWLNMFEAICTVWPHDAPGPLAPQSDLPVLVIRGLMSPYLADDWDVRIDRSWPRHVDVDLPTVTFGTDDRTPLCVSQLLQSFWEDPTSVDAGRAALCAEQSPPVPFAGAS